MQVVFLHILCNSKLVCRWSYYELSILMLAYAMELKFLLQECLVGALGVKKMDQGHQDAEHFLPWINMCTTEGEYPFILCRRQLPVRPAFTMTIHKAQGQTVQHVGIRLQGVFAHGPHCCRSVIIYHYNTIH